jgi:hypothetical protein
MARGKRNLRTTSHNVPIEVSTSNLLATFHKCSHPRALDCHNTWRVSATCNTRYKLLFLCLWMSIVLFLFIPHIRSMKARVPAHGRSSDDLDGQLDVWTLEMMPPPWWLLHLLLLSALTSSSSLASFAFFSSARPSLIEISSCPFFSVVRHTRSRQRSTTTGPQLRLHSSGSQQIPIPIEASDDNIMLFCRRHHVTHERTLARGPASDRSDTKRSINIGRCNDWPEQL